VEEGQFVEIHPLASLAPNAPIEFAISGNSDEYLDLFNTFLHVRAKVTLPNGDKLPVGSEVAPVNYFLHSLFSQVDVSLNDTMITPSENTYPYRAVIECLMNHGEEAKKGHLGSALFFKDTPKYNEDTQGDENTGFKARREIASGSQEFDMMGKLHSDIFAQDRFMLNGLNLKIKLTPSKDAFNLMATDPLLNYKSTITHAVLVVRKAKVNPAIALAHEKALMQTNAKYPIKRVAVKTLTVPQGMLSHNQDNLFLSQTPTRLVVGLVSSSAFNGSYKGNPFNFRHWDVSYLNVTVDGRTTSGKPLIMDYAHNQYVRAFYGANLAMGLVGKDAGNDIDYRHFKNGYTLYAFDLSPSLLDGDQFEMPKAGPVSLEFKFGAATPEPLQIIVYAELDSVIEISQTRQVLMDYAS
jgi:hypothetical protein